MARGPQIEQDELFETANRLEAEGKEVTALSLLNALGRGSLTTIYKHLDAWKASRPAKVITSSTDMPDPVKNAFAGAWRVAAQEAAREIEEVRAKAAEDVKEAQKQFHGALDAIEKLERDREADAEQIEALRVEAAQHQQNASRLEAENAAAKAATEEIRRHLETQQGELDRLRADIEKMNKDIERMRAERDEALKDAAERKGTVTSLQAQNAELMKALTPKK